MKKSLSQVIGRFKASGSDAVIDLKDEHADRKSITRMEVLLRRQALNQRPPFRLQEILKLKPDITLTASFGPDGTQLAVYQLHRSVLISQSAFFKCNYGNAGRCTNDVAHLPVVDHQNVFPFLIKFMYEKKRSWPKEKHAHVCYLAYKLGVTMVLHQAKQDLDRCSTKELQEYLEICSNDLKCEEFTKAVADAVARRLAQVEKQGLLQEFEIEGMEWVLKSSDLDLVSTENIPQLVEQYVAKRQHLLGKKLPARAVIRLQRIANILQDVRQNILPLHSALLQLRASGTTPNRGPSLWRRIKDIKSDVYSRLQRGDLENIITPRRHSVASIPETTTALKIQQRPRTLKPIHSLESIALGRSKLPPIQPEKAISADIVAASSVEDDDDPTPVLMRKFAAASAPVTPAATITANPFDMMGKSSSTVEMTQAKSEYSLKSAESTDFQSLKPSSSDALAKQLEQMELVGKAIKKP